MSNESRAKDRISFQEVAKLAATPKPASESPADMKDNSGMIDFAALAASEAQATRGKPSDFAKLPAPVAPPPVSSRRTVERQSPASAVPPPAPTSPLPFGTDAPAGRQPPSAAAATPPMASSFGATSHTLPGVGQRSKNVPPTPALPAARLPPPQAPRVAAGPSTRTPSIAAPPPAMAPLSTLSPATFSPETGRPMAMAAGSQGAGGAGAVWLALGVGMGLGALLATVFFQTRAVDASHAAAQATERPQVVKTELPSAPTASGGGPSSSSGPNSQALPGAVAAQGDTNAVPAAEESPPAGEALAKHNEPAVPGRGVSPPSSTVSPAGGAGGAGGQAPAPAKGSTAPISDQSLEALMKKAVGIAAQPAATPPAMQPAVTAPAAATPAGDVPIKPAMGAVQGAVGTVLPATRYCLGPDDAVSHATITFKSDGSAQSVAVSGPAAGQPAEACIRSRLMTARVPPFSSPTFTWTVTVRPAS